MNRICILFAAIATTTAAHADPTVQPISFADTVVYGTDTFETSGGALLSTLQ